VILTSEPDIALVGEAATGETAQEVCAATRPDVLLLDLRMPGPPATETVSWVRAHCPTTRVVMLTAHREDAWVRGLIERGAAGYVLKDDAMEATVQAIRVVAVGGTWFSPTLLPELLQLTTSPARAVLTHREQEILGYIAAGHRNAEIAEELSIAGRTVEFHISHLLAKLGARSRTEALHQAQRQGLLLPQDLDAR